MLVRYCGAERHRLGWRLGSLPTPLPRMPPMRFKANFEDTHFSVTIRLERPKFALGEFSGANYKKLRYFARSRLVCIQFTRRFDLDCSSQILS